MFMQKRKMGIGFSQDEDSQTQATGEESSIENSQNLPAEAKPNHNTDKEAEKALKAIHKLDEITKDADFSIDNSSIDKLLTQLQDGIFLNQKRKKYWVDKMANNCFMLYARDLSITWAEDNRHWIWHHPNQTSDEESIEVAELIRVCWLEVHGKFDTKKLSPETLYEVAFVVMLKHAAHGWEVPLNVQLSLPDGTNQERKVNLSQQPKNQWMEITAGKFRTSPQTLIGEIRFSMFEYEGGQWKRGLLIKGVTIQPRIMY